MNMRESFEKEYPVPDGICWEDSISAYTSILIGGWANHRKVKESDQYNKKLAIFAKAWQASRTAIVLPEPTGGHIAGEYGNGYADALHQVKQAIGAG